MKTTVIYHKADFDGIFCREIARKFRPEAIFIGWDYGDPKLEFPDGTVYVLDLSPECFEMLPDINEVGRRLFWIDHHKSAIEKWPEALPGYRIDGVAACRLAWQFFTNYFLPAPDGIGGTRPSKEHFVNRQVLEPWAVRLAGEYDIWDKRDPDAELFQHGLRSCDLTSLWPLLLRLDEKASIDDIERLIDAGHAVILRSDGTTGNATVVGLLEKGKAIQYAKAQENESIIKASGFTVTFEGLTFLACNHARYNSHLFTAGIGPKHEALLGFNWDGEKWRVSLYHAPHRTDLDLSAIAVKYGGGGHRGACGFRVDKLPFLPQ